MPRNDSEIQEIKIVLRAIAQILFKRYAPGLSAYGLKFTEAQAILDKWEKE